MITVTKLIALLLLISFSSCTTLQTATPTTAVGFNTKQAIQRDLASDSEPNAEEAAATDTFVFGDIIRKDATNEQYCLAADEVGGICRMTQRQAINYCASIGQDLPNVQEFVMLAMSLGAQGFRESCKNGEDDCYPIIDKNYDFEFGKNYSSTGYQRPQGDLGNAWFWSSSGSSYSDAVSYVFRGSTGFLNFNGFHLSHYAVRCVSGR